MKKPLFFLLLLMLLFCKAFAETRGIRKVEIRTKSGEKIGLYEESHALVIGVSDYTNGWADLESVTDDVKEVSKALRIQDFNVVEVLNPTREKLASAFNDFINDYGYKKNNRLLFYYSGHGHTKKVSGRNRGYLVPIDAPIPSQDQRGFSQKAIPMIQIHAWAKQIESKHALFLFDSCFSGSILKERSVAVPRQIQALTAKPVRMFITAGTDGEPVPAESVFRHTFIRGIRGDADLDKDSYITGTELGLFIQRQVMNYNTGQTPQFDKMKDPLYDEGDFVFLPSGTTENTLHGIDTFDDEYLKNVVVVFNKYPDQNIENIFNNSRSFLVSGIESLVQKIESAKFSGQSVIDFEKDFENNLKKFMSEKNSNTSLVMKTEWDIKKTSGSILWEGLASMNVSIDYYSFKKGKLIKKGSYSVPSQRLPLSKWGESDSFKQKHLGRIANKVVTKWSDDGIKNFIQSVK